jgi:DNA-binding transcriptional MerR regulator
MGMTSTSPTLTRTSGGWRRYSGSEVEWLLMCTKLRSSSMPLPDIRRYAELVRLGLGNEAECFALLRDHQDKIRAQLDELNTCLDVIPTKVDLYRAHLDAGTAGTLWTGAPGPRSDIPR